MKIRLVTMLILLAIVGRGEAGFYTGSEILSTCESRDRMQEIFVEYAKENPGELDEVGSATAIAAFLGAFPCI